MGATLRFTERMQDIIDPQHSVNSPVAFSVSQWLFSFHQQFESSRMLINNYFAGGKRFHLVRYPHNKLHAEDYTIKV